MLHGDDTTSGWAPVFGIGCDYHMNGNRIPWIPEDLSQQLHQVHPR